MEWLREVTLGLAGLRHGWAGPETTAPSAQHLSDFAAVMPLMPSDTPAPSIVEIDDGDGTITLLWINADHTRSTALVFCGLGNVIGCKAGEPYRPWKLPVGDAGLRATVAELMSGMEAAHD
jgi:hypothetical protein